MSRHRGRGGRRGGGGGGFPLGTIGLLLLGALVVVMAAGVSVDTGPGNRGANSPQFNGAGGNIVQYGQNNSVTTVNQGPSSYDPANIGSAGWSNPFGTYPNTVPGIPGQALNNVGNAADGGYQITKVVNGDLYGQTWTSKGLTGTEQKLFSGAGAKVGDIVYVDQGKPFIVNPAK